MSTDHGPAWPVPAGLFICISHNICYDFNMLYLAPQQLDWEDAMLSEEMKQHVRDICRRNKIGIFKFQENGIIHFFSPDPELQQKVVTAFPDFEVTDYGNSPMLEDRPDDMRQLYWIDLLPKH